MIWNASPIRRRRSLMAYATLLSALAVTAVLVVGVAEAMASSTQYYHGSTCCSNRHAAWFQAYMTNNFATAADNSTVCVQEHVYPAGGSPFFDNPACGPGGAGHSLNGQSLDQAYCWVGGGTTSLGCDENY